jgi:hypothetical protein
MSIARFSPILEFENLSNETNFKEKKLGRLLLSRHSTSKKKDIKIMEFSSDP